MKRLTIRVEACTEILALLIIMAWADGKLASKEKDSVRAAASVLNLNKSLRARLDSLLEAPVPLDQIIVKNLNPKDRAFAYVAAVWLSGVDEDLDPKESDALRNVAQLLELDDDKQRELAAIAREIAASHTPLRKAHKASWADDLVSLFKAIPKRLEAAPDDVEVEFTELAD